MPIRINLLAEAKAAEELRRHDPVKRVIYCGAFLVVLLLVYSSSLLLKGMLAKKAVTDRQMEIESRTNEFERVKVCMQRTNEVSQKLEALRKMTDCRFLQGNLLNTLQQVHVDGVRLMRITVDQSYMAREGASVKKNAPPGPVTVTERINVKLDAVDYGANAGDQVNKMKDAVANHPYFKAALNKTNGVQLITLSAPQLGADGKTFVPFTLECNFPEVSR